MVYHTRNLRSSLKQFWNRKLHRIGLRRTPTRWKQLGSGYFSGLSNVSNTQSNSGNCERYGVNAPSIEKIVEINGKQYRYRETEDGKNLYLFRRKGVRNCFEIEIKTNKVGETYAYLNTFYNFEDCSIRMDSTGSDMLLAIIKLLEERGGIAYMEFSDNSGKQVASGKWMSLCDMYFLTSGNTWYGSVIPIIPDNVNLFERARTVLFKTSWDSVASRILEASGEPIRIPVNISDINTSAAGSAVKVFQRIKDAKTDFFADYKPYLMPSIGFESFTGSVWRYYFDRTTPGTGAEPGR